jgi:DtxR family transcriptional regulator, Mn-dependent transcriptional regulator
MSDVSVTMRDYLAKIYTLSAAVQAEYVSTSTLAETMDVSAPAVNRMVTKLKEIGLLLHEPYQGIMLTDNGKREALIKLRYERIASAFLTRVMGFGWHEVSVEAARMSSALSESLAQRMLEMSDHPVYDPHGEPIPSVDGTVPELDDILLSDVEDAQMVCLTRVLTRESDRLEYIAALGLVPGVELEVIHKAPFNGPMQLRLGDEYRIIGHNLAELVRVRPIETA